VLTLAELTEMLASPPKKLKPAVVITFDDGYANNLLAGEVLGAAGLPWSVFVSTGAVGPDNAIWTVELSMLLLHGQGEKVEALGKIWPLTSRQNREATFQGIRYPLKSLPADVRRGAMDHIRQQFSPKETRRLLQEFPSLKMLTWEEISQLAAAGVEIGSHGVDHEIHHSNQPETVRHRELVDSKAELENRLNRSCRYFAFPNGDVNPASADEAGNAGYDLAFTTQPGTIAPGANPYLLPRLEPAASMQKFINCFSYEAT
jgi:peptidoglycan/xylan/chitin deacetylase (PgdA/CDA1 family)